MKMPLSALGIHKGAGVMLSTPPAIISSASSCITACGGNDAIHARTAQAVDLWFR